MKRNHIMLILFAGLFFFCCADNTSGKGDKDIDKTIWYPVAAPKQETKQAEILLPASRDYLAYDGIPIRVLFNHWLRDPYILNAPDGYYYMTGTTDVSSFPKGVQVSANANGWWYNDGVPLWRSKDLVNWETMGYVWSLDRDAIWAKEYKFSPHTATDDGSPVRAVWAPEIHWLKGTYWITYSMNYDGIGILKSVSGKPEGPYEDIKKDGPLPGNIDVDLFEDSDGTVYYLTDGYSIAKMKPDMSGLAEEPSELEFIPSPPWAEGITMTKIGDNYVWYGAANSIVSINGQEQRTYDCFSATSRSVYGPYTNRYRAIPYAGHNNIFEDKEGNLWSTQFHPQPFMDKALEPALLPVEISDEGIICIKRSYPRPVWKYSLEEPQDTFWMTEGFDDSEWKKGEAGFGNPEIQNVGSVSDVGTEWDTEGIWMRRTFTVESLPMSPKIFLRYTGAVEVWINGVSVYSVEDEPLDYLTIPVSSEVFKTGENTIAVSLKRGSGLQYLDIGVINGTFAGAN